MKPLQLKLARFERSIVQNAYTQSKLRSHTLYETDCSKDTPLSCLKTNDLQMQTSENCLRKWRKILCTNIETLNIKFLLNSAQSKLWRHRSRIAAWLLFITYVYMKAKRVTQQTDQIVDHTHTYKSIFKHNIGKKKSHRPTMYYELLHTCPENKILKIQHFITLIFHLSHLTEPQTVQKSHCISWQYKHHLTGIQCNSNGFSVKCSRFGFSSEEQLISKFSTNIPTEDSWYLNSDMCNHDNCTCQNASQFMIKVISIFTCMFHIISG